MGNGITTAVILRGVGGGRYNSRYFNRIVWGSRQPLLQLDLSSRYLVENTAIISGGSDQSLLQWDQAICYFWGILISSRYFRGILVSVILMGSQQQLFQSDVRSRYFNGILITVISKGQQGLLCEADLSSGYYSRILVAANYFRGILVAVISGISVAVISMRSGHPLFQ